MTKQELQKQYNIPHELLEKYAKERGTRNFGDDDAEKIGFMMTLYDAGFNDEEVERYIRLCRFEEDNTEEREKILAKKREEALSAIHANQKQLDGIDYLRYKLMCEKQ